MVCYNESYGFNGQKADKAVVSEYRNSLEIPRTVSLREGHEMMDKRKLPRHSTGGLLKAALKNLIRRDPGTAEIIRANVMDLSHGGAGLCVEVVSAHPYQPGNSIFIEIILANGSLIGSEGEVKWTRLLPNQAGYQLGVQFKKIDNQDKARLKKFLDELDKKLAKG